AHPARGAKLRNRHRSDMSRIAAVVCPRGALPAPLLAPMLRASGVHPKGQAFSASKGPGAVGFWGQRSAGFLSSDGLLIALDGTIYNRDDLEPATSDVMRFATLYRRHGFEGALQRINGDFAVVLFDSTTDTLFAGRDRFGIKPLYYVDTPEQFA